MPMTVEYRNGVQSSTISYSNMVIPEGITNKSRITSLFPSNKIQYVGCKCKISAEINSNVSKMIQANSLFLNFQMKSPCYLVTLSLESSDFQSFLKQYVILVSLAL